MARRKRRIRRTDRRIYLLIALIIILAGLCVPYIAEYFHTASLWKEGYYYPHDRERQDHLMDERDDSR
jgi:hypothetical protein